MTKILIVDDSDTERIHLKTLLKANGYEVVEADDGVVSIDIYKREKPDVVLMDIVMWDMDGIEALEKIMEYDSDAKIIMITAKGDKKTITKAIMDGALEFITKPFDNEKILHSINRILKRSL